MYTPVTGGHNESEAEDSKNSHGQDHAESTRRVRCGKETRRATVWLAGRAGAAAVGGTQGRHGDRLMGRTIGGSGVRYLYKVHSRGCHKPLDPTECDCSWRARYEN